MSEKLEKQMAFQSRSANKGQVWLLFLLLGWSYGSLDQIGTQIVYYLTLGGLGVWTLVRLFTLNGAIKEYNRKIAASIGMDNQEMALLGLI